MIFAFAVTYYAICVRCEVGFERWILRLDAESFFCSYTSQNRSRLMKPVHHAPDSYSFSSNIRRMNEALMNSIDPIPYADAHWRNQEHAAWGLYFSLRKKDGYVLTITPRLLRAHDSNFGRGESAKLTHVILSLTVLQLDIRFTANDSTDSEVEVISGPGPTPTESTCPRETEHMIQR